MTVLGFDYGTRRIGVAVGQTVTKTATPLGTVPVLHSQPDWHAISAMIQSWRPDLLVVGLPTTIEGTEHPLAPAIRRFVQQLRNRYGLPVETVDECLSSYEAQIRIASEIKRGTVKKGILPSWRLPFTEEGILPRRRHPWRSDASRSDGCGVDAIAAQVILETWFSQQAACLL